MGVLLKIFLKIIVFFSFFIAIFTIINLLFGDYIVALLYHMMMASYLFIGSMVQIETIRSMGLLLLITFSILIYKKIYGLIR